MQIKAGTKLYSAVCNTQIMVLRVPADDLDVTCGGLPMHTEEVAEVSLYARRRRKHRSEWVCPGN